MKSIIRARAEVKNKSATREKAFNLSFSINVINMSERSEWNIRFSDEMTFHVSLRRRNSTLVFNEFFNNSYLCESRIPVLLWSPFEVTLTFLKDKVRIAIDGEFVQERTLAADLGLNPIGEPDWEAISVNVPQKNTGALSPVRPVNVMNQRVLLPSASRLADLDAKNADLLRLFIDGVNLLTFGELPIFVDMSETRGALSSLIRSMYPRAQILHVAPNIAEAKEASYFLNSVGVDVSAVISVEDIADLTNLICKESRGGREGNRVVLIGADIYLDRQSYKYKALVDIVKSELNVTVICNEDKPVPPCVVFESSSALDVYINVFWTEWRYIWESARQQGRRSGLDIVVAMYNSEEYIEECIRSLNTDSRADIRVLVVDDGSTDGSGDVVRRLTEELTYVQLLTKPNGGCASARNYGRLKSDASHIAFVDADDYMDAGAFGHLFDLAAYSSRPVVQCGFITRGMAEYEGGVELSDDALALYHDQTELAGKKVVRLPSSNVLYGTPGIWRRVHRRDFLDGKNIWFPEHIRAYDDFIFFVLTARYTLSILHLSDFRYNYRQHPDQDVRKRDSRHFYAIEMGHMLLQRAITEGWHDVSQLLQVLRASINWSLERIDAKYLGKYIGGVASLVASFEAAFGTDVFSCAPSSFIPHIDFPALYHSERERFARSGIHDSYVSGFLHASSFNAEIVNAIGSVLEKRIM